jgi:DNA polymerase V
VSSYLARAAEKLRQQGSLAAVHVFVLTYRFRTDEPQNCVGILVPIGEPSDDTWVLTRGALAGLQAIFKPVFRYQKAGILLTLLSDKATQQGSLFDDEATRARSARLRGCENMRPATPKPSVIMP